MTGNNGHKKAPVILLLASIVAAACMAQTAAPKYGDKMLFQSMAAVTMDAGVHSWKIGNDTRIVQGTFPMSVVMPVSERALFSLSAVPATVRGADGSIAGVPETRIGASYVLPGEKWWLSGAMSMPTGTTRLSMTQAEIAASIAQPALGYPMPSMGHGFNTTLGCAYASSVSRLIVFGFGAALSTKGAYEPVAPSETSTMTYAPGNEIAANIGVDVRDGLKTNRFSADYTVTYYFSDKLNGERFFQSGTKASLVLVGIHDGRTLVQTVRIRLETRAHNISVAGGKEDTSPAASRFAGTYSATLPLRENFGLTMGAELQALTSDQFPVNGEVISTGGGTVGMLFVEGRFTAAHWCVIMPHISFGLGSVTVTNSERHAEGFDAGLGFKFFL